jgi:hypothetical protein
LEAVNIPVESIDRYEIGKELGLIDEQTDNLVNVLLAFGYIKNVGGNNIELSAEGRKKTEVL